MPITMVNFLDRKYFNLTKSLAFVFDDVWLDYYLGDNFRPSVDPFCFEAINLKNCINFCVLCHNSPFVYVKLCATQVKMGRICIISLILNVGMNKLFCIVLPNTGSSFYTMEGGKHIVKYLFFWCLFAWLYRVKMIIYVCYEQYLDMKMIFCDLLFAAGGFTAFNLCKQFSKVSKLNFRSNFYRRSTDGK